ncbi:alpha/beta hydrolase [Rhizobiaceae bacterium n13]|nr:alpha/beta hydrolase fold domain-containing protein [Fererhizobium litorale]MDI7864715.1 alpha/beta hydrolase [Fererhizobium litorale]
MSQPVYDPQLAAVLATIGDFVPTGMTLDRLPYFRAISSPTREDLLRDHPVDCVDHRIMGFDGGEILVSVISRRDHHQAGPAIYFLHGGGMVMGNRFAGAGPLIDWAIRHDAVCVTVEYRLAPEHPAPIPVEDCYAGLVWMASHSVELKFDPERLVIFGGSGGGGLAAGTTLMARDRNGPRLLGQLLQCPMIDDRNSTVSASRYDGVGVWDTTSNKTAWQAVLGEDCGGANVSPYSAPARVTDLAGLPPTFIDVGACEVFRDEAIDYAVRILASGGQCELHVWGGAFHGFYDIAPQSDLARACVSARNSWLERLLRWD